MTTPTYTNPPIVELIIGVQFSPLTKFTTGHFGLFWKQLGDEWTNVTDAIPLEDQFELFDDPNKAFSTGLRLKLERASLPGRFMIEHRQKDRLIQIQPSRFLFNWRRNADFYPSYKQLIVEFEAMFERFRLFIEAEKLGRLLPNQWELTYIDAFPKGKHWQTQEDWQKVLPGLFGNLFSTNDTNLKLEQRAATWSYEIPPKQGRLHISANQGRVNGSDQDVLLLQMTARGPIPKDSANGLRGGLDLGHNTAVTTFLKVVNPEIQKEWS